MCYTFTFQMEESLDISAIEEAKEFQCKKCPYRSRFKHNVTRHEKLHMKTGPRSSTQLKQSAPVPSSSATQPSLSAMQPSSSATQPSSSALQMTKKHICDQCGKQFQTKYGLNLHISNKHDKIFKYMCQMCQKGFNQAIQYRCHCAKHLKVSLQRCSYCGKDFRSPGCLKEHVLICKENPNHVDAQFVCPVCSSSFSTRCSLQYHKRGKHQPPKYHCSKCWKSYAWRSSLRAHLKIAHSK